MPNAIPLSLWDHAYALIAFLLLPVHSRFVIGKVLEKIRQEGEPARLWAYRQTIVTWGGLAVVLVTMWTLLDRNWAAIGFTMPDPIPLTIGLAVAALFLAVIVVPLRRLSMSDGPLEDFDKQIGDFALLMPRTKPEVSWFYGLSTNAGLTEELIFRGYLIWYLQHFMPLVWSAILAAVVFALAHLYQGAKQLPGLVLVSAITVALYVYTGSLIVPVLFHILLDVLQGHYFAKIHQARAASVSP